MHLQRLYIKDWRNLRDFEIEFTRTPLDSNGALELDGEGNPIELKSHAVIGQNGSGKSNMIEVIAMIFRDLDLNLPASLDYELDYEVREFCIEIKAVLGQVPLVRVDGNPVESWLLSDTYRRNEETGKIERGSARLYLPSHVFTYYSGKNDRLEGLFTQHQREFIDRLNDELIDELSEEEKLKFIDSDGLLRRMFYCQHPHARLVLLACLLAPEKPLKAVLENLRIRGVDSALFVLKQPYRLMGDELAPNIVKDGDGRFWFDESRFSQEFLDKLWDLSVAPIGNDEEKMIDFRGRTEEQEVRYFFVDTEEKLNELRDHVGDSYRFFRYVEGSYIADLLDDLKIYVKHQTADGLITFEALSEGELQLLTVLGLMRLTHQDHCLFLLDEPDTHLNPKWKLTYFEQIEEILQQSSESVLKGDSQILVTTHDPMMIGSLRKEQVKVLKNSSQGTIVENIDEHPKGMGVAGLLKSEYFGLASTLDSDTRKKMQLRNELLAKRAKGGLSNEEEVNLNKLQDYLEDLGFSKVSRDPLYQMFIEQMYSVRSLPLEQFLTPDELSEREALAERVVKAIVKNERDEELSSLARELKVHTGGENA